MEFELKETTDHSVGERLKVSELYLKSEAELDEIFANREIPCLDLDDVYLNIGDVLPTILSKSQSPRELKLYINNLHPGFANEIAVALGKLLPGTTSIHLTLKEFNSDSVAELGNTIAVVSGTAKLFHLEIPALENPDLLRQTLAVLPESVSSVHLECDLGGYSGGELANIFGALRKNLEGLILRNNNFDDLDAVDLTEAFKPLGKWLKFLAIEYNRLANFSGNELANAFCIFENLETLSLKNNQLGNLDDLAEFFKSFHLGLKELSLAQNDLSRSEATNLAAALKSIAASLRSLDLSGNDLNAYTGTQLAGILKNAPKTMIECNLADNDLFLLKASELVTAFEDTFESLIKLDLSANEDQEDHPRAPSAKKMELLFEVLPKSLMELNLGRNFIGWLPAIKLGARFFGKLPPNLRWLGLSDNYFDEKSGATLAKAFSYCQDGLESIDLADNNFYRKTDTELLQFLGGIPSHLSISLKSNCLFNGKTHAQIDALLTLLKEIDPEGDQFDLSHNGESIIARAITPMISAIRQHKIPAEIINNHIFPHLSTEKNILKEKIISNYSFFNKSVDIAEEADNDVAMSIETDMEEEHSRGMKRSGTKGFEQSEPPIKKMKR
jgi:Ran GTPase-activating protein (RanGAP) involved in mRNA processing and transport